MAFGLAGHAPIPLEVTTFGSLSGLLGLVFLLSPSRCSRFAGTRAAGSCWPPRSSPPAFFSNASARFLIPALPFVALAMVLVLNTVHGWPSPCPAARPDFLALRGSRYCRPDAWHITGSPGARRSASSPRTASCTPTFRFTALPAWWSKPPRRARPSSPSLRIPEAYTSRHVLTVYQSADNIMLGAMLLTGYRPGIRAHLAASVLLPAPALARHPRGPDRFRQ